MKNSKTSLWWGPPKKFTTKLEERKISWLELFYDLVYVIAIACITKHLSDHLNVTGFLDYVYMFVIVYWGWLNGSLHYDIHGTNGLRTNLMTLWQILIVAGLVVTMNSKPETLLFNVTIAIMMMQIFITYLWWSIGVYDKSHRKFNLPYTICYLSAFALLLVSVFIHHPLVRILYFLALLINYLPAFIRTDKASERRVEFELSSSMTERFGLFTIILFGEVIAGLISGVSEIQPSTFTDWVNFSLAVLIVFSLWWIFFSMIADKQSKSGFMRANIMSLIYIPTLMSLGIVGVSFQKLFIEYEGIHQVQNWIIPTFGIALSVFLIGIILLTFLLNYEAEFIPSKYKIRITVLIASIFLLITTFLQLQISLTFFLLSILLILLLVITVISKSWFRLDLMKQDNEKEFD